MRSFVILLLTMTFAAAEPIGSSRIRVIDGDTIRLDEARPDVRLVGFNTPETRRAENEKERELGGRATRRLRDIVRSSKMDLQIVTCACRHGTEGTQSCNYGRKCGKLTANGRDVGDILISEGLAVKYECTGQTCPKAPAPWH